MRINCTWQFDNIDHSKTRVRSPQTNGMCEHFHKTMKNEFYDIAFRKKLYHTIEELQADVDRWLKAYNEMRPHSGRFCYGKTPLQTFKDAAYIAKEKILGHAFEPGIAIKPREDVMPSSEGVTAERGIAPWQESDLEHD